VPVVVGAFPEPFLHGYGGKVRPAVVVGEESPTLRKITRLVHGRYVGRGTVPMPRGANVLVVERGRTARFSARWRDGAATFLFVGDPSRLLQPSFYRYRYRVP
jgi:hypothetical protein